MANYFDRYLRGEHEQVWVELFSQGDAIHEEPLWTDALAVTKETMKRVRYNIELLIVRLNALGYVFGIYPYGHEKVDGYTKPHNPPSHDIAKRITKAEALEGIGSFPLSLRTFWEIVGDVDFTGHHPALPRYSDPLIVFPIETIDASYPAWRYQVDEGDIEAGQFRVPLAPDYYHKDNVSGGAPYSVRVPNNAIDGLLENERHETTFVDYLRICFRYGGFPGVDWQHESFAEIISSLINGLIPI